MNKSILFCKPRWFGLHYLLPFKPVLGIEFHQCFLAFLITPHHRNILLHVELTCSLSLHLTKWSLSFFLYSRHGGAERRKSTDGGFSADKPKKGRHKTPTSVSLESFWIVPPISVEQVNSIPKYSITLGRVCLKSRTQTDTRKPWERQPSISLREEINLSAQLIPKKKNKQIHFVFIDTLHQGIFKKMTKCHNGSEFPQENRYMHRHEERLIGALPFDQ